MEERLRNALEEAKAVYQCAKIEYRQALECRADLSLAHPDGRQALAAATKTHQYAFEKYTRALLRFNRFILDGKLPEDPEDQQ